MKRIIIYAYSLLAAAQCWSVSTGPLSTGSVQVDGRINDWDLSDDFYAKMYRAGDPGKKVESNLYLKYNCTDGHLCFLVLREDYSAASDQVIVLEQPDDAWIKIDGVNGNLLDGFDSNFSWVRLDPDDPSSTLIGWEGCVNLEAGTYNMAAHAQVFSDGEAQTSRTTDDNAGEARTRFQITIPDCGPGEPPVTGTYSIVGNVLVDPATCDGPIPTFPFPGVGVQLNGSQLTTTVQDGSYTITGLTNGSSVTITLINPDPSAYYVAPISEAYANNGNIVIPVVISGSNVVIPDMQFNQCLEIGGSAVINVSGSGLIPFAGAQATITGTADNDAPVSVTAVTDDNGEFSIGCLRQADAGGYAVTYSYGGVVFGSELLSGACERLVDEYPDAIYDLNPNDLLDCLHHGNCPGEGRTIGFWKAQLSGRKGKGENLVSQLPGLLANVETVALDDPYIFSPVEEGVVDSDGVAEALGILDLKQNSNPFVKLAKQLLAAELNAVTESIGGLHDDLLEGALFNWGEYLLNNSSDDTQLLLAKDIFDAMNNL